MDFFAGSGTLGAAAAHTNRDFVLIDNNPDAISVMVKKLRAHKPKLVNCEHLVDV